MSVTEVKVQGGYVSMDVLGHSESQKKDVSSRLVRIEARL